MENEKKDLAYWADQTEVDKQIDSYQICQGDYSAEGHVRIDSDTMTDEDGEPLYENELDWARSFLDTLGVPWPCPEAAAIALADAFIVDLGPYLPDCA